MPTYSVTATHRCLRCSTTAKREERADPIIDRDFRARATPQAPGWRDVTIPHPSGPALMGELCPACVAAVAAFIMPSKES